MKMNKKTSNIMKGVGVAMAVGSVVATATSTMGQNSFLTKKKMKKAVNKVTDFVDTVSSTVSSIM